MGLTNTSPSRRQALSLGAAMGLTALLAWRRKPSRRVADERAQQSLESIFPNEAGTWRSKSEAYDVVRPMTDQAKLYGIYDQVLERVYARPDGMRVMLSVAYGTEQSAGLQMHRPEGCYASSGFKIDHVHHDTLQLVGQAIPITRLLAKRARRIEPITYWSVLGDAVQADETTFRWHQLLFGFHGEILDGMLVRISSIDPDPERAFRIHAEFASDLASAMTPAQRIRVLGRRRDDAIK